VFSARGLVGVKVAIVSVESRETIPGTGVVPAPSVKVPVLIVAGSITLLNVAVTSTAWQTPVAAPVGNTETTVGAAVGEVGAPALSESPKIGGQLGAKTRAF